MVRPVENHAFRAAYGLAFRTPIGSPFREYAGFPIGASDYGGEMLVRVMAFYLRGAF